MPESLHNPDRYMADLRQILSQGRKRIGLLVGAGAPISLRIDAAGKLDPTGKSLIPGVNDLTATVLASLAGKEAAAARKISADLGANSNIENILSRARLLEQALGSVEVEGLDGPGYAKLCEKICAKIGDVVGPKLPIERNAYHELISWVSGTLRSHAVEIFTTNYDLLFEEAFERAKAPYFDGFTGGSSPFFDPVTVSGDDLPSRWSRLWKLHGSLGWSLEGGVVVRSGGRTATQLVYPESLKYDLTQKQPYAALFERLREFLLNPDTLLLTIGFSFRDAHICAVLDEALAMNKHAAIFAFQYGKIATEEAACKLALQRPNLSVYAADEAVISGVRGRWVPGDPPKNWTEIRQTFWGGRPPEEGAVFLLGDFSRFTRFCALAQAVSLTIDGAPVAAAPVGEVVAVSAPAVAAAVAPTSPASAE